MSHHIYTHQDHTAGTMGSTHRFTQTRDIKGIDMNKYLKWIELFKFARSKRYSKRKSIDFALHVDEFLKKYKGD